MLEKFKSKKTLVFCCAYGYKEAFLAINNISKLENISEIVSIGCTFGFHDEINECIELTKNYIILKSRFEEQLVEYKEPFVLTKLSEKCFLQCKEKISDNNKKYLSQLPYFYKNDFGCFYTLESKLNSDKLSFCLPIGIRNMKPFVISKNGDRIDQPINVATPIKSLFKNTIYPGDLFNTLNPEGFGYVCIFDNESIAFKKLEYSISDSTFYKAYLEKYNISSNNSSADKIS